MKYMIYACLLVLLSFTAEAQNLGAPTSGQGQGFCPTYEVPQMQACPAPGVQQVSQIPGQLHQQLPLVGRAPTPRVNQRQQSGQQGPSRAPALAPAQGASNQRSVASQGSPALDSYYGQNQQSAHPAEAPYSPDRRHVRSSSRFFNPQLEVQGMSTNQFYAPRSRPLPPEVNRALMR